MADKKEIPFTIDKQKAIKIAKKAASGKFAIMKDDGATFKVGSPGMTATVEVGDGVIYVSGKALGGPIANTIYGDISNAIEEAQENSSTTQPNAMPAQASKASSIEDQLKIAEALKAFKDLLDAGVITQEEFDFKKKELLNNDFSGQPSSKPDSQIPPDDNYPAKENNLLVSEEMVPNNNYSLEKEKPTEAEEEINEQKNEQTQEENKVEQTSEQKNAQTQKEEQSNFSQDSNKINRVLSIIANVFIFTALAVSIVVLILYIISLSNPSWVDGPGVITGLIIGTICIVSFVCLNLFVKKKIIFLSIIKALLYMAAAGLVCFYCISAIGRFIYTFFKDDPHHFMWILFGVITGIYAIPIFIAVYQHFKK